MKVLEIHLTTGTTLHVAVESYELRKYGEHSADYGLKELRVVPHPKTDRKLVYSDGGNIAAIVEFDVDDEEAQRSYEVAQAVRQKNLENLQNMANMDVHFGEGLMDVPFPH